MHSGMFIQLETPQIWCKLWILVPARCRFAIRLHQVCRLHRIVSSCENQTSCNLMLGIAETTCIKLADKTFWLLTCFKLVVNLQQTCYHQGKASDANASWYGLDHCQVTSCFNRLQHSRKQVAHVRMRLLGKLSTDFLRAWLVYFNTWWNCLKQVCCNLLKTSPWHFWICTPFILGHSYKAVIHFSYFYSQLNSPEHGNEAKTDVLKAFLELLPSTINSESSGGVHWFFTLLTGMLTIEDLNGAGKSCMELLMKIAQQLDRKLTYHDRVLRAR